MRYTFGDVDVDEDRFEIRRRGIGIETEPRVIEFIIYLIGRQGRLVSKQELLTEVWKQRVLADSALTRCACLARKALGDAALIATIYGKGYRWASPPDAIDHVDWNVAGALPRAPAKSTPWSCAPSTISPIGTMIGHGEAHLRLSDLRRLSSFAHWRRERRQLRSRQP